MLRGIRAKINEEGEPEVTPLEIIKRSIMDLASGKAAGPDCVEPELLKLLAGSDRFLLCL